LGIDFYRRGVQSKFKRKSKFLWSFWRKMGTHWICRK